MPSNVTPGWVIFVAVIVPAVKAPLTVRFVAVPPLELRPANTVVVIGVKQRSAGPRVLQPDIDGALAHPTRPFAHDQHAQPGFGRPVVGRVKIAALMKAFANEKVIPPPEFQERTLNGQPAFVAFQGGRAFGAILISIADGKVRHVFLQTDPQRLKHLGPSN